MDLVAVWNSKKFENAVFPLSKMMGELVGWAEGVDLGVWVPIMFF